MNLKSLNDEKLFSELVALNQEIRHKTTLLLFYLKEVDSRKLFAKLGYSSLIEFCIKELKLSETAAYRRVKAMQILKELPQVAEKIDSGALNLNQLAQAQTFFQKSKKELNKPKTAHEKHQVLCQIENKSLRETEKSLFTMEPDLSLKPKESLRAVSAEESLLKITLDQEAYCNLQILKEHFLGRKTLSEIVALLVKEKCERIQKKLNTAQPVAVLAETARPKTTSKKRTRHIPNPIKRLVLEKANNKCQYKSPITGKECESKQYLEIDHIHEFAKGGKHTLGNLQLLCFEHHKLKTER